MEEAEVSEIYESPKHPYTQLLFHSILDGEKRMKKITDTEQSRGAAGEKGCPFYNRCHERTEKCMEERPENVDIHHGQGPVHYVKCFKYMEADKNGET